MKQTLRVLTTLFLLYSVKSFTVSLQGRSVFVPRSQTVNAARDAAGLRHNKTHRDTLYTHHTITTHYAHSARPKRIAAALFGTDILEISGSMIDNRGPEDMLADYFGLSPAFASTVHINPVIHNVLLSYNGYLELNQWAPGLYLRLAVPFVSTHWQLKLSEQIEETGAESPFPALYMATDAVTPSAHSFTEALQGNNIFGDMQSPLKFGKIGCGRTKNRIANIKATLGYHFISYEDCAAEINVSLTTPTGQATHPEFLFDPVVGNNNHWQADIGLYAKSLIWEKDAEQELWVHAGIELSHLFKKKTRRSFDLTFPNGFWSRYMLVKEFNEHQNPTGALAPLINHTTLSCDVHINIQCEALFMFAYHYRGFTCDLGYNGWMRSREKIKLRDKLPEHRLSLKGIQNSRLVAGDPSPLTESSATILGAHSFNDQLSFTDTASPVFITSCDLDLHSGASSRMFTHKLFTYTGYTWDAEREHRYISPFVGIGAEVEFEGINGRNTRQPNKNTLSQWGFWLNIGLEY